MDSYDEYPIGTRSMTKEIQAGQLTEARRHLYPALTTLKHRGYGTLSTIWNKATSMYIEDVMNGGEQRFKKRPHRLAMKMLPCSKYWLDTAMSAFVRFFFVFAKREIFLCL